MKLMAPPVENKANKALVSFLAKTLEIRKSDITILSGQLSRDKQVDISSLTEKEIYHKIGEVLASQESRKKRQ